MTLAARYDQAVGGMWVAVVLAVALFGCGDDPDELTPCTVGDRFVCSDTETCFPSFSPENPGAVCVRNATPTCSFGLDCPEGLVCVVEGLTCCGSEGYCLTPEVAATLCESGPFGCSSEQR